MECHRYRTTNFLIPIINFHVTAEFQFNFFSSTILHSLKPSSSPLLLIDNADLDNFYRSSLNNQIRKKKGRESSQVKKQERINKNKKQLIFLDWILQMENCMHADWNSWLEIGGGGPFYSIFSATLNSPRGRGREDSCESNHGMARKSHFTLNAPCRCTGRVARGKFL